MTSWTIQNDITACLADFIWNRIKENISEYHAMISDESLTNFQINKFYCYA